jgi:hypothetical protein
VRDRRAQRGSGAAAAEELRHQRAGEPGRVLNIVFRSPKVVAVVRAQLNVDYYKRGQPTRWLLSAPITQKFISGVKK